MKKLEKTKELRLTGPNNVHDRCETGGNSRAAVMFSISHEACTMVLWLFLVEVLLFSEAASWPKCSACCSEIRLECGLVCLREAYSPCNFFTPDAATTRSLSVGSFGSNRSQRLWRISTTRATLRILSTTLRPSWSLEESPEVG